MKRNWNSHDGSDAIAYIRTIFAFWLFAALTMLTYSDYIFRVDIRTIFNQLEVVLHIIKLTNIIRPRNLSLYTKWSETMSEVWWWTFQMFFSSLNICSCTIEWIAFKA